MHHIWNSTPVKITRWIAFLPIGIILVSLIESLTFFITSWFFGLGKTTFIIICLFFGGIPTILPFAIGLYYGVIHLVNRIICPNARVGVIAFSICNCILLIQSVVNTLDKKNFNSLDTVIIIVIDIIFFITTIYMASSIVKDIDDEFTDQNQEQDKIKHIL